MRFRSRLLNDDSLLGSVLSTRLNRSLKRELRAKSPHLVKLTGVDPLGVVLPLKRRVPIEAGVEPARVWRRLQSSASLISSDLQVGRTRGHKLII